MVNYIRKRKEIFDVYKDLGTWKYEDTRDDETRMCTSKVFLIPASGFNRKPTVLGVGIAARKGDAQQKAAEEAIRVLNQSGYKKDLPPEYAKFDSL